MALKPHESRCSICASVSCQCNGGVSGKLFCGPNLWCRMCRMLAATRSASLPPSWPDPIPGAIDLLLLLLILLRVRETKTRTTRRRTIHILSLPPSFRTCSSSSLPLFLSVAFMLTSHSIHHFVSEERRGTEEEQTRGAASF